MDMAMARFLPASRAARRTAGVVVTIAVLWGLVACQPATAPLLDEEFSGSSLNSSTWHPNRWFASNCAAGATAGEEAWYRPGSARVANGNLVLTATRGSDTC